MGRKGADRKGNNVASVPQPRASMTLREESTGKKQANVNAKTMCKLDHLKSLATRAATETSIPSLGAFFGQRLAASTEAVGARSDPSIFLCERCESILQPGNNCTVRIEKNKTKTQQNSVVYKCHFCSHRNMLRGTPKDHVKQICPQKTQPYLRPNPAKDVVEKCTSLPKVTPTSTKANKIDETLAFPTINRQILESKIPATPSPMAGLSLLDAKKRKRNRSGAKKVDEHESSATGANAENSICESRKRKKKSWTSLKEIAKSAQHEIGKKSIDLTIPFCL